LGTSGKNKRIHITVWKRVYNSDSLLLVQKRERNLTSVLLACLAAALIKQKFNGVETK